MLSPSATLEALGSVRAPLLFLALAVPLAVTLDDLGLFTAIAARIEGTPHHFARLWALATAVVIVFNLDAAVVLLTPLYIRLARRHGLDAEAVALQPALLACLASGVLPVSNLTNLIAAEHLDLTAADFLANLVPATLAATVVGFLVYRRVFHLAPVTGAVEASHDPSAIRRGVPIVVFVLAGFSAGDLIGIPAWVVALAALAWATTLTRHLRWRTVPADAIALVGGFVVVATAAAPHLGLERAIDRHGVAGELATILTTTGLANLINNLPATVVAVGSLDSVDRAWPLLLGANIGAALLVTGSLSTLLWRDTAAELQLEISARRWTSVAARVTLPALVAASAVHLALA
ncbi:MAG: citrate transporter [Actinomyces sp.]|nr:MAG: citrate transporter [Actinomyces sp.]